MKNMKTFETLHVDSESTILLYCENCICHEYVYVFIFYAPGQMETFNFNILHFIYQ